MTEAKMIFPAGMYADKPHENAPGFVIARTSFKVREFKDFLDAHANERGYVNIDILESKAGDKYYGVLNDYVAKMEKPEGLLTDEEKRRIAIARGEGSKEEIKPSDIPF